MRYLKYFFFLFVVLVFSCEKNITVDLPESEDKLVVEGWIEQGLPPFVILSKSTAYFSKADLASFENSFVHNATVTVNNGTVTDTLTEFCSQNFTSSDLILISEAIGIPLTTLQSVNYCLYTNLSLRGEVGKNYSLKIISSGKTYTAYTQIPNLVPLDSVWFQLEKDNAANGWGFAYGHLTDPDTVGNCYRWTTKRLGKDENFLVPFGASVNDVLVNGKSFQFYYNRPTDKYATTKEEDEGYFKTGDTIVVKFSTMDKAHYDFLSSYENFLISNGNPFATPATIKTNIKGNALGVWGGFGVTYDTIYCK